MDIENGHKNFNILYCKRCKAGFTVDAEGDLKFDTVLSIRDSLRQLDGVVTCCKAPDLLCFVPDDWTPYPSTDATERRITEKLGR